MAVYEVARGWPAACLSCTIEAINLSFGKAEFAEYIITGGLDLAQRRNTAVPVPYVLPLRPIWPGFLINTLFYAVILWLLICGPFVLRRHIRLKRGRCPKCGYDLRGQLPGAGCPECGWNRQPEAAMTESVAPRSPAARG
jgi:hypothetical protein